MQQQQITYEPSSYREEFVAMGLFHVAKAVSFLSNDCSLVRSALLQLLRVNIWVSKCGVFGANEHDCTEHLCKLLSKCCADTRERVHAGCGCHPVFGLAPAWLRYVERAPACYKY